MALIVGGAGGAAAASFPVANLPKPWYQPTCIGELPQSEYEDLLSTNLWKNHPNDLSNFCAGTPFFWPEMTDRDENVNVQATAAGSGVPSWSPTCRCEPPRGSNDGHTLKCFAKDRPELISYCESHCQCKPPSMSQRWRKAGVSSKGSVKRLDLDKIDPPAGEGPQDLTYNAPEKKTRMGCFGSCTSFAGCSSLSESNDCGHLVCRVQETSAGLYFASGICVAATQKILAGTRGRLGGRSQEQLACSCNATYVSAQCCSTTDGIVYEDSYKKLGQLIDDEEVEEEESPVAEKQDILRSV